MSSPDKAVLSAFEAVNACAYCPNAEILKGITMATDEPNEYAQKECRFVKGDEGCKAVMYLGQACQQLQEINSNNTGE